MLQGLETRDQDLWPRAQRVQEGRRARVSTEEDDEVLLLPPARQPRQRGQALAPREVPAGAQEQDRHARAGALQAPPAAAPKKITRSSREKEIKRLVNQSGKQWTRMLRGKEFDSDSERQVITKVDYRSAKFGWVIEFESVDDKEKAENYFETVFEQASDERWMTPLLKEVVKNSKYLIFSISAIIILILAYFVYLEINSRNQSKLAEEYNYIVNNFNNLQNSEQSTERLIRIVEKKNSTYSPLSLYFILDNELVTEKNEINKYFDMVINIGSLEKEIKNLNIYKKAIYNSNFVDEAELVEILRPITNSDSIWKSHSLFLLAEFFYYKENKAESKKLLNEIINYENSNSEIKLEAQKKLVRDFSE